MSIYKGILSIQDPAGSYIGMQNVARDFLIRHDIDITTQGPKKNPIALVITVTAVKDRDQDEKQVTRVKGDYKMNATTTRFSAFLSSAIAGHNTDKLLHEGRSAYYIYINNGIRYHATEEEFFTTECDFSSNRNMKFL